MLVQCIAEKQGIKVIEFSARTGGCIKYEMIERVSGVDVIGSMLESTLGKTPTIEPSYSNSIVSDEFVYTKEGVFGSVVGAQECVDEGLISSYHILHSPGKVMGGISCSGDRVLAFTIVAKTESEYKFKLKEVALKIDVLDVLGNSIIRRDLLAGVNDE